MALICTCGASATNLSNILNQYHQLDELVCHQDTLPGQVLLGAKVSYMLGGSIFGTRIPFCWVNNNISGVKAESSHYRFTATEVLEAEQVLPSLSLPKSKKKRTK